MWRVLVRWLLEMYFSHPLAAGSGEPIIIQQTLLAPQWHPFQSLSHGTRDRSRSPQTSFLCSAFLSVSFQMFCSSSSSVILLAKNSRVFPMGLPNKLVSSYQKLHEDLYKQARSPVSPNSTLKIHRREKSSWLWLICCNLWAGSNSPGPLTAAIT